MAMARRVRGSGAHGHAMMRARMRAVVMGGSALGSSKKTPRIGPLIESSASSSSKPLLLRYVGVTRVLIDSEYCRLQSRKSATLLVSSHTPMQSSRMFASSPASLSCPALVRLRLDVAVALVRQRVHL